MPKKYKHLTDEQIKKLLKVEKYKKRPSPPYHAGDCKNCIVPGNDGNNYVSKQNISGVYQWKRLWDARECKTPYEYHSQFGDYTKKYDPGDFIAKYKLVSRELLTHGIYCFKIGWKNVGDFIDFAWEDAVNYVRYKINDSSIDEFSKTFVFYTENGLFWATHNTGEIEIQHNISRGDKKLVIDVFKKHFGNKYKWNGTKHRTITVKI